MSPLPSGTVTFLFTDIEGSTRLAEASGAAWPSLLDRHNQLLRDAIAAHGGIEFGSEGDAVFAVFESAADACRGVADAQRALAAEPWPDDAAVRVRMGLHTGEGMVSGATYVGLDVHRAARIAAAGHGGEVLLSGTTQSLVGEAPGEGLRLTDLGEHRLRDLSRTEHLWRLLIDGLPAEFPPPRTLNAIPNNLPSQLTTFLGRQRELAEARQLLTESRLLTLTGPGGTGKTRLALEIAASETERYPDGVYFVALGQIVRPELVIPTIAQAMGAVDPGRQALDRLAEQLATKCVLLVLDNFEQVIDAAPQIAELLARAPKASALVTSRSPLRISGEHEYPVPPLGLPDLRHLPDLETFSQFESVALFVERAMAARPDFGVSNANAPAVAEICVRLDGLPLAIELAAARVRVLSPQAILDRLSDRLALLSGGARDLPARQQTLRGAIAWSHDLLDEKEKAVFAHLSVFAGGVMLEAVEEICFDAIDRADALDLIESLVEKSLVRQDTQPDGEPRFRMLETIRDFAMDQLKARGEEEAYRDRHAAWMLSLVEGLAARVFSEEQREALDAYERENDNLRAALAWLVARKETEKALRMLASSWRFWQIRGYLPEARENAERVLAMPDRDAYPDQLGAALEAAGGIAYWQADLEAAREWYEGALQLARASGDESRIANALYNKSFAYSLSHSDAEEARRLALEAVELYRKLGDEHGLGRALWGLSNTHFFFADFAGGIGPAQESLEIFEREGDRFMAGWALYMLGLYKVPSDPGAARADLERALPYFLDADDKSAYGLVFDAFAAAEFRSGDVDRALRLAGFSAATEAATGGGLAKVNREYAGFYPESLIQQSQNAVAYTEGQQMSVEEATRLALRQD